MDKDPTTIKPEPQASTSTSNQPDHSNNHNIDTTLPESVDLTLSPTPLTEADEAEVARQRMPPPAAINPQPCHPQKGAGHSKTTSF